MNEATTSADHDFVQMVIDTDSCIGAGQCELHEPEIFLIGDDDVIAVVIGDGRLLRSAATAAADRCPGRAISFVEIDDAS